MIEYDNIEKYVELNLIRVSTKYKIEEILYSIPLSKLFINQICDILDALKYKIDNEIELNNRIFYIVRIRDISRPDNSCLDFYYFYLTYKTVIICKLLKYFKMNK